MKEANRNEGIISPRRRRTDPRMGEDAIMALAPQDLGRLVRFSRAREVPLPDIGLCRLYQTDTASDSPLTLAGPCLGAPQAVIAMEKLVAMGARRIWVLGCCGSIQPSLRIGGIILPTSAVSEEGTSRHYPLHGKVPEADLGMIRSLEHRLEEGGITCTLGRVWSIDAPYRETPEKVRYYQQAGVMAVEMELSALMTLAAFRSVSLAGLLVVSDEAFDLSWRPGFSSPPFEKASRAAGEILLRLLRG